MMFTGLHWGSFKNTFAINTGPMVSDGRCKVNTREINYYKWIQMSFWQGNTVFYTPADPSIMRLSNPGIESRNNQWKGARSVDCHSQKNLLVFLWTIQKDWWQIKRVRLICGTFAMKYSRVLEEIPGAACMNFCLNVLLCFCHWSGMFHFSTNFGKQPRHWFTKFKDVEMATGWSVIIAARRFQQQINHFLMARA